MTLRSKDTAWVVVGHLCAVVVAAVFMFAAYPKITIPQQFAIDIRNYHILPERYLNLVALFLPWLEATAAAALIVPRTRRAGAILIGGMLLVFIIAVASALARGLDIECGCFGKGSSKAGWLTIIRNVALLAATALAVWLPSKRRAGDIRGFEVVPAQAAS